MKKHFLSILLLASIALSGFAHFGKTEQFVLNLSKKKFDWMINRQYDSLKKVLDDRLEYIHSNGWSQSKKEVMDDFTSGKLTYQEIKVSESSVRLYDKTAIITGKGKFSVTVAGNSFAMELTYTEVYIKNKKDWVLTSRHANKMP